MTEPRWRFDLADLRAAVYVVIALVVIGIFISNGCAGMDAKERVQSAVTVLAEVIDPTYDLAMSGCIKAEGEIVSAELDGGQTPEDTNAKRAKVQAPCNAMRERFDTMMMLLVRAEALLGQGDVATAESVLEEVRKRWRSLNER